MKRYQKSRAHAQATRQSQVDLALREAVQRIIAHGEARMARKREKDLALREAGEAAKRRVIMCLERKLLLERITLKYEIRCALRRIIARGQARIDRVEDLAKSRREFWTGYMVELKAAERRAKVERELARKQVIVQVAKSQPEPITSTWYYWAAPFIRQV